ncbi:MAG: hypothetical protein WBY44_06830 [Bryobacteraceae bacterium]|jgi:hypothetical protein
MLTIRNEQMTVIATAAWRMFEDRLVRRFETELPRRFGELGEPEVRKITGQSIESGRRYAFSSEADIGELARLAVEYAPDLHDAPGWGWARELLGQRGLSSSNRIAILAYRMRTPQAEI